MGMGTKAKVVGDITDRLHVAGEKERVQVLNLVGYHTSEASIQSDL